MIGRQEIGTFHFGSSEVAFRVKRSNRRFRTIALTVDAEDGLTVLAPQSTSLKAIHLVMSKRAAWIIRKLADVRQVIARTSAKDFVDGQTVRYLGRCYRLRIVESPDAKSSCGLINGWLELILRPPTDPAKRTSLIYTRVGAWYRNQAKAHLAAKLSYWGDCYGSQFGKLIISNQTNRWGSCDSKNNIRINWRIMMAPPSLIDYVVAHELAHTIHKNHSADFWRLLGSVMPDYDLRRNTLKRLGPMLSL